MCLKRERAKAFFAKNNLGVTEMKSNIKRKVFAAFLAVVMLISSGILSFTVYAAEETSGTCGDTAQYKIDNGTLTIWGYGSIADKAFQSFGEKIKNVVIKEGITSIGKQAFYNKTDIISVSLPESLSLIENWAFQSCKSLKSINLNNVTSINVYAFYGCRNLEKIEFNNNKEVSIGAGAFYNCGPEEIYISENVNMIEGGSGGQGVFSHCDDLKKVTVNSKYLPSRAFANCENLSTVMFGDKVETIGKYAFSGTGLSNLVIPENVSTLGESVFSNCINLITADLSKSNITKIYEGCFYGCTKLEKIQLPKKLEEIERRAFYGCKSLPSITIPASVNAIIGWEHGDVFCGCINLRKMEVEKGNSFYYSTTSDGLKTNAIIEKSESPSENDTIIYGCVNTVVPRNVDIGRKAFCEIGIKELFIYNGINRIERDDNSWNYYKDLTNIWYEGTEDEWNEISWNEIPEGRATIHYNWNGEIRRNIYFNPNSADATLSILKYENVLSTQKVMLPTPVWTGHKCLGWSIYPHSTTAEYKCGEIYTSEINVTLYAVWDNNGSESDKPEPPVSKSIIKESNDKNISCIYENGAFGTGNDEELSLVVKEIGVGSSEFASFQTVITDGDPVAAYTIKIVDKNNKICQPKKGQAVTVKIKTPEGIKATDTIFIYHKTDDGKVERIKMTDGNVKFENGYIVFKTTSFSHFIVAKESNTIPGKPVVKSVQIDNVSLSYKSSTKIKPVINADNGATYVINYKSSNPKVASIDDNGKVTALKKGSATITCTVTDSNGNSVSDTCEVKVVYTWWQWLIKIVLFGWIWY